MNIIKVGEKMMEEIVAIIVTYNRKKMLYENLVMTLKQNLKIKKIIIIDNHGNDSTEEYLIDKGIDFSSIDYIYLDENIGGAGGFYTGLKYAYENGFKWFILMDDDGKPLNESTFSSIFEYINSKNYSDNQKIILNSLVLDNNKLSFGLYGTNSIEEIKKYEKDGIIESQINPFNGTMISRGLVKSIGYPNKDFFIKGDEMDYMRRAIKDNAIVATIVDSLYYHPSVEGIVTKKIFNKTIHIFVEAPWKEYYSMRNAVYSNIQLGDRERNKKILLKKIFCILVCRCCKIKTLKMVIRGYKDGKKGKLGATVRP